ncbi:hypothetical protein [Chromobacterium haemolyticum]|uniref:hypothetical protein n=1 Tax=Chromobacterium haemolyticum TaxID=394935 RepID=UPI0002F35965|nr:hypothetical protein [Chromobacterium haemolyticum]
MAIFFQLSDEEIRAKFTHRATFCGFVPIYVNFDHIDCHVAVRNWWPDWMLDVGMFLFDLAADSVGYERGWPIKIQGRISED